MSKRIQSMMGIESPTGSHLPVLEQQARAVGDGLIIEHGAGLYSTPLLARLGCRVLCAEPHPAWREWARWIYQDRAEIADSWKAAAYRLTDAALVFIDGPAAERGKLLSMCIEHKVPRIVAHDTDEKNWHEYGWSSRHFAPPGYRVSHSAEGRHRTTLWTL